ncbi:transcriptional repressor NrdR [Thiohalospira halophila DSM 15071]|uniref:Transcriptional repressor NrdR n=1 Tax=Thiohalospira halophila DSM 15071 TaxID=1123397 RepID=A0A1I1U453_9GAMM|nr:transcriptional regulator NrdR [Thiohalospira halophila]SFD65577.1 transcriptional repressor NrdR [Thiohalospira halophila DSM 15071]
MRCPFCGAADTRVVDSRLAQEGDAVRRRRACGECGERFTTFETAELTMPRIVKRDGSRETFDEAKLRAGIQHALEKRPVGADEVEAAVGRITRQLHSRGEREVSADLLGEWVMDELRAMDHVAYVRFASVYRSFEDIRAFRETIDRLERGEDG